jgi:serine/threonine protein kinase
MNKALLHREKQVEHVFAEKQVLRLLHSPFIVRLLGTCQTDINLFCVMEYVAGGELFKLLVKRNKLAKAEAGFYLAEVVQALCCLHALRCLYRDLKPENILITATGHVKLADMGFAKLLSRDERTFTMCGTPEYIAPELISASGCGLELDWWQLGILLYEMLAGKTPFMDASPYRLYEKVLTAAPNLSYLVFDEDSSSLITGLLCKLPQQRLTQTQILNHSFFRTKLRPPHVPVITDPFDTSCFDVFAEEHSEEPLNSSLQRHFQDY